MRDLIKAAPITTICYVKDRAWSAGALIALAHQHIAIAPGGSIGAAEPIPATEKTVAALKAEFAATANFRGRNPRVAEAMVDKSLGYDGYAQPGQILAFTDYQAVEVGYADLVASDRAALLQHFGLSGNNIIEHTFSWPEQLAGWLSDHALKSVLLTIIFLAVMAEIKTAGLGVAALIGIIAALLFFGSQWLTGLAGWLELTLFALGAVLIILELFFPGTTVFGLLGALSILGSFFLTLGANAAAINIMALSIIMAAVLFLLLIRRLPESRLWSHLVLNEAETTQAGFVSANDYSHYVGRVGVAVTPLRPAGAIMIDAIPLDVVSEGQFVAAGSKVVVIAVNGSRIVVRPVEP